MGEPHQIPANEAFGTYLARIAALHVYPSKRHPRRQLLRLEFDHPTGRTWRSIYTVGSSDLEDAARIESSIRNAVRFLGSVGLYGEPQQLCRYLSAAEADEISHMLTNEFAQLRADLTGVLVWLRVDKVPTHRGHEFIRFTPLDPTTLPPLEVIAENLLYGEQP